MPWIDPWGNKFAELPERIRLADYTTRTAEAATPQAAVDGGWVYVQDGAGDPVPVEPAASGQ